MALIECSECGGKVSTRAAACPHCGCPVEPQVTCPDCGEDFTASLTACPACGGPVEPPEDPQELSEPTAPVATPLTATEADDIRTEQPIPAKALLGELKSSIRDANNLPRDQRRQLWSGIEDFIREIESLKAGPDYEPEIRRLLQLHGGQRNALASKDYSAQLAHHIFCESLLGALFRVHDDPHCFEQVKTALWVGLWGPILLGLPEDGPGEGTHENGQLEWKGGFKDRKLHGPYESYHENGQPNKKGTYIDGKWDGPYESYYANGQLAEKGAYSNGKEQGLWERFYENGQLGQKATYKDGEWTGLVETYQENGHLEERTTFADTRGLISRLFFPSEKTMTRHGPSEEYYENGLLKRKGTYNKGYNCGKWIEAGVTKMYKRCPPGLEDMTRSDSSTQVRSGGDSPEKQQPESLNAFKDGEQHGLWLAYHENGQLEWKGTYKDGKEHGPHEVYYESGQLRKTGAYKDGHQDGPWLAYHENGQLECKLACKDGEVQGPSEEYYENGQLKSKGIFKDGKLHGPSENYYENGQLKSKGVFKNLKHDGLWEWYHENGQLHLEATFKDGKEHGPHELYGEDGHTREKGTYNMNRKCGEWIEEGKTKRYRRCPPGLEGGN